MASIHKKPAKPSSYQIAVMAGVLLCGAGSVVLLNTPTPPAATVNVQSSPTAVASASASLQPTPSAIETTAAPAVETPVATASAVAPNAIPAKAEPLRIDIPAARISTTVSRQPMTDAQRQERYLVPPNEPTAYWSDLFDQPGGDSADLTYISGHGCEGLSICETIDWQFSRLSDPNLIKAGTDVSVFTKNGEVCYKVDENPVTYEKTELKHQSAVFGKAARPGKLVLVSCYTAAIHDRNVVVIASVVSCRS
jgi:hypothetical protein